MTRTKEELTEQITELKDRITELEEYNNTLEYDEFLDDTYGDIKLGELTYSASRVLETCDPVAYRCGHNDYNDSLLTSARTELEELEEELKELEQPET